MCKTVSITVKLMDKQTNYWTPIIEHQPIKHKPLVFSKCWFAGVLFRIRFKLDNTFQARGWFAQFFEFLHVLWINSQFNFRINFRIKFSIQFSNTIFFRTNRDSISLPKNTSSTVTQSSLKNAHKFFFFTFLFS